MTLTEHELADELFDRLFPIARSITGTGYRMSLGILGEYMPIEVEEVPSGSQVFDWTVPDEWVFRSARLTAPDGEVVADTNSNNLHIVSYSEPIHRTMPFDELDQHLHSIPQLPTAVPYATSYYTRTWGFCISDEKRKTLPREGLYQVEIDSEFVKGAVQLGRATLHGESGALVLLSSYLCHPSLANNELSGPLALVLLHDRLRRWPRRRLSYQFLINPETIGALCFLKLHGEELRASMVGGAVLTCLGGPSETVSYKLSKRGDSLLDTTIRALVASGDRHISTRPFSPLGGSDERQYCAPGFNLPMGQFARTVYGEYPEYHNSLDSKQFMNLAKVIESVDQVERVLRNLEIAGTWVNLKPHGEPQLSKYDLYPSLNASSTWDRSHDAVADNRVLLNQILTILSASDGQTSLAEIALREQCVPLDYLPAIDALEKSELARLTLNADHGR